jgi:serine/threonine protein kinase
LEERDIIHCDLKPENILICDQECKKIKIVDFGVSTKIEEQIYTYVQSRFYRAPEVILRIPYTTKVDMWSLGCILAELFTGEPLFPANSEQELFEYIMELKGCPPQSMIIKSRKALDYFDADGSPYLIRDDERGGILRIPATRNLAHAL